MNNKQAIHDLAVQYKSSRRSCAESVIESAVICHKAKLQLIHGDEYDVFLKEIGETKNSSYLKKLHLIAKKESRFRSVIDFLPPASASLYLLSRIEDQRFDALIQNNEIYPTMTIKQVSDLIQLSKHNSNQNQQSVSVRVVINDLSALNAFHKDLSALKSKYYLTVHDDELQKTLNSIPPSSNNESCDQSTIYKLAA